ncbi:RdgB/HAM1 family non-canonical purine NTP pyrophosphatase [Brucepastera parasyntrophica]|uniref:RdgB/HAM1 family non-canonical purine NTP pyrophosphatase n=1 Tax=Brucepastera parasyntrophica TaxID=2880008 RepID=UPI002109ABAC|nr:RdgB/HAM1 family non-canonical purine NTP pyrophosphatase [Brucepastera parasyntrophica]ULQ59762.1 RdgB/HAM1 family non-canonical purine NTP pyrophosphatase [Brucepastera parasyntrophica]
MKIYLASGNAHKRGEISRILYPHTITIPSDEHIAFDPEETADSFFGNALIKAKQLFEITGFPAVADDSGICVDALNGEPGIYSARYGAETGAGDDKARNRLLLSNMEGITERKCRFICNMVLYYDTDRFYSVQETLEGILVTEGRGTGGFGYDPLVYLPEYGKTVAELTPEEKDACSHRGKAVRKLACIIETLQ